MGKDWVGDWIQREEIKVGRVPLVLLGSCSLGLERQPKVVRLHPGRRNLTPHGLVWMVLRDISSSHPMGKYWCCLLPVSQPCLFVHVTSCHHCAIVVTFQPQSDPTHGGAQRQQALPGDTRDIFHVPSTGAREGTWEHEVSLLGCVTSRCAQTNYVGLDACAR